LLKYDDIYEVFHDHTQSKFGQVDYAQNDLENEILSGEKSQTKSEENVENKANGKILFWLIFC